MPACEPLSIRVGPCYNENVMPESNRILLVEDDDVDREAMHRMLGDEFDVVDANTGFDAREILRSEKLACALVEYILPDMDGSELVADLEAARVPFIMVVGGGSEEFAAKSLKRGASGYLPKQMLNSEILSQAVGSAIDSPSSQQTMTILYAEDEEADRILTARALKKSRFVSDVRFVENGVQLLDYLHHRGKFCNPSESPRPDLILLDLNMPEMSGHEALEKIRQDPGLADIPIVVLTSSLDENDITRIDELAVDGYCPKPVGLDGLATVMELLGRYWIQIAEK